jgi:hypothetical protein
MTYATRGILQCSSQGRRTIAISLEQMKGDALRGLAPNARHTAQGIDQAYQQW